MDMRKISSKAILVATLLSIVGGLVGAFPLFAAQGPFFFQGNTLGVATLFAVPGGQVVAILDGYYLGQLSGFSGSTYIWFYISPTPSNDIQVGRDIPINSSYSYATYTTANGVLVTGANGATYYAPPISITFTPAPTANNGGLPPSVWQLHFIVISFNLPSNIKPGTYWVKVANVYGVNAFGSSAVQVSGTPFMVVAPTQVYNITPCIYYGHNATLTINLTSIASSIYNTFPSLSSNISRAGFNITPIFYTPGLPKPFIPFTLYVNFTNFTSTGRVSFSNVWSYVNLYNGNGIKVSNSGFVINVTIPLNGQIPIPEVNINNLYGMWSQVGLSIYVYLQNSPVVALGQKAPGNNGFNMSTNYVFVFSTATSTGTPATTLPTNTLFSSEMVVTQNTTTINNYNLTWSGGHFSKKTLINSTTVVKNYPIQVGYILPMVLFNTPAPRVQLINFVRSPYNSTTAMFTQSPLMNKVPVTPQFTNSLFYSNSEYLNSTYFYNMSSMSTIGRLVDFKNFTSVLLNVYVPGVVTQRPPVFLGQKPIVDNVFTTPPNVYRNPQVSEWSWPSGFIPTPLNNSIYFTNGTTNTLRTPYNFAGSSVFSLSVGSTGNATFVVPVAPYDSHGGALYVSTIVNGSLYYEILTTVGSVYVTVINNYNGTTIPMLVFINNKAIINNAQVSGANHNNVLGTPTILSIVSIYGTSCFNPVYLPILPAILPGNNLFQLGYIGVLQPANKVVALPLVGGGKGQPAFNSITGEYNLDESIPIYEIAPLVPGNLVYPGDYIAITVQGIDPSQPYTVTVSGLNVKVIATLTVSQFGIVVIIAQLPYTGTLPSMFNVTVTQGSTTTISGNYKLGLAPSASNAIVLSLSPQANAIAQDFRPFVTPIGSLYQLLFGGISAYVSAVISNSGSEVDQWTLLVPSAAKFAYPFNQLRVQVIGLNVNNGMGNVSILLQNNNYGTLYPIGSGTLTNGFLDKTLSTPSQAPFTTFGYTLIATGNISNVVSATATDIEPLYITPVIAVQSGGNLYSALTAQSGSGFSVVGYGFPVNSSVVLQGSATNLLGTSQLLSAVTDLTGSFSISGLTINTNAFPSTYTISYYLPNFNLVSAENLVGGVDGFMAVNNNYPPFDNYVVVLPPLQTASIIIPENLQILNATITSSLASLLTAKINAVLSAISQLSINMAGNFSVVESQLSGLATLSSQISSLNTQLSSLSSQITSLSTQISSLSSSIGSISSQISSINSSITSINSKLGSLQSSVNNAVSLIQTLQSSLNTASSNLASSIGVVGSSVNGLSSSINSIAAQAASAGTYSLIAMVLGIIAIILLIILLARRRG